MFCVQLGYNKETCQHQVNPHPLMIYKESHMTDQEKYSLFGASTPGERPRAHAGPAGIFQSDCGQ